MIHMNNSVTWFYSDRQPLLWHAKPEHGYLATETVEISRDTYKNQHHVYFDLGPAEMYIL